MPRQAFMRCTHESPEADIRATFTPRRFSRSFQAFNRRASLLHVTPEVSFASNSQVFRASASCCNPRRIFTVGFRSRRTGWKQMFGVTTTTCREMIDDFIGQPCNSLWLFLTRQFGFRGFEFLSSFVIRQSDL